MSNDICRRYIRNRIGASIYPTSPIFTKTILPTTITPVLVCLCPSYSSLGIYLIIPSRTIWSSTRDALADAPALVYNVSESNVYMEGCDLYFGRICTWYILKESNDRNKFAC